MSRIVGIKTPHANQRSGCLTRMLPLSASSPHWNTWRCEDHEIALGWTGWREPKVFADEHVSAVIDGCVFNREEFTNGKNDAQRIVHSYRRRGFADTLSRLNGDFAIALYDATVDTLWLGRDRIGIKPLYYVARSGLFAFASRIRPLLELPGVRRDTCRRYVALFAASHYRYFDNESHESPIVDISQLPAGHLLAIKNGTVQRSSYWKLEELPDWTDSEDELAGQYRDLLLDCVSRRIQVVDRPAFTLSGGMDSSSILASTVSITGKKQQAISTIYEDKTFDESNDIKTILSETVEQWHTVSIGTPDVFDSVNQMIEAHDEPVATATWLSHFMLCRQASSKGFDSLFGGLGGDELNAGEYEYFPFHFADLRQQQANERLTSEIRYWIQYHDHPVFRKSRAFADQLLGQLVDASCPGICRPDRARLQRYAKALNTEYFDLSVFQPNMDHPFRSYLKNRTFHDLFRETAPCCLRAEDRQTVAFELDNFLPFLDYRLVEFMYRVPGQMKIRDGVTKRLLRKAMKGILPDQTRQRVAKTGWNAPAHQWFSGAGADLLRDLVGTRRFRERGIYDVAEVERLIDEHDEIISSDRTIENHMMFLWQLVNLELWLVWLDSCVQGSGDSIRAA